MRLTRPAVNIFESEVRKLESSLPDLYKAIDGWVAKQEERDSWGSVDPYWLGIARDNIERAITKFHDDISALYDLMGDRGLVERELI